MLKILTALAAIGKFIPFLDRILDFFVFKRERAAGAMEQELKQREETDALLDKMEKARAEQRARDDAGGLLDDDPDRRD